MIDRDPRRHSRGQSLVEFALVIPLFLVMLFGIIDIGRVIWANDALANAAREGARFASVTGSSLITPDEHESRHQDVHPQLRDRCRHERHCDGVLLRSAELLGHGRLHR